VHRLKITKHSGKLAGVPSINTSPRENAYCERMSKIPGSVCQHCYARRLVGFRAALARLCVTNGELLSTYPMAAEMPRFDVPYVRFHSFGELINVAHLMNFYDIAAANPATVFALWTKRRDIVAQVKTKRPENLVLVYSVSKLDPPRVRIPADFDHAYAVYTTGPDCGTSCLDCLKCYNRTDRRIIRQRLH